jgi:hypothetical protein
MEAGIHESKRITYLLQRLVQNFTIGVDPSYSESQTQSLLEYVLRILGSRISPSIVGDEYSTSQLIQKKRMDLSLQSALLRFHTL